MMARSTQTNEPARCAILLPLLARLPQPLALLEVGAAAGLCLLPDRYAYNYDGRRIEPSSTGSAAPIFYCQTDRAFPAGNVDVVWRAGLDLNPIDVRNEKQVAWLEALVWPDEEGRLDLLRAALAVAKCDPPRIVRGDLRKDLPAVVAEAPKAATLVIFHTSVLCYVPDLGEREAFAAAVRQLGATWISNEGVGVLPWVAEKVAKPWPNDRLLLALNEEQWL
jgi:hypothetical protein